MQDGAMAVGSGKGWTVHFGKRGPLVTRVGLGGEGVLRTWKRDEEARGVIQEAIGQGITYYDTARVYDGSEFYYGSIWRENPQAREWIFQASKSARRDKRGALDELRSTLEVMGTDRLDLWQIHDVRTKGELGAIEAKGGALEAFEEARKSGRARFIGVTGHHDPKVLVHAVKTWPLDAVMIPVNPIEGILGGFLDDVLPLALEKGLAVIGMKVLGGSHFVLPGLGLTPRMLVRYALSKPVTLVVVGCSTRQEAAFLARTGKEFAPLTQEEEQALLETVKPYARHLAYYRGHTS